MSIHTQNRDEIKKLLEDTTTPDHLKSILRQADARLEITQDLIKIKQELLEKIFVGKE